MRAHTRVSARGPRCLACPCEDSPPCPHFRPFRPRVLGLCFTRWGLEWGGKGRGHVHTTYTPGVTGEVEDDEEETTLEEGTRAPGRPPAREPSEARGRCLRGR